MENDEIEIEIGNDIPKVEYIIYQDKYESNNIYNTKSKKLYISPETIKYDLIIEKNEEDQIIISITEQTENSIIKYQSNLNIQNFINLSPYFKLLYTINSLYCIDNFFSFIKEKLDRSISVENKNAINNNAINLINLNNSKIKISHVDDNKDKIKKENEFDKIYFIFDITYINLKKEEIKIILEKTEFIHDSYLINIYKILLRNKYNYINRINHLEKKLSQTQNSYNKYGSLLSKYTSYFDQDLRLKMSFLNLGIDTNIFDTPDQYSFILTNLCNLYNKNNISLKQIFKASCNGDNIHAFHIYCDNIKHTLILILTDDKRKFGGYTSAIWDMSNKYKFDDKAFLFSLDTYEIFFILDKYKNKAINCRDNFYAPIFGNDLFIFDGFFSSKLNRTEEKYFDYSKSKNPNEEYKLAGQRNFTVSEMEVYKINFSV
jgi:hypothetical protein